MMNLTQKSTFSVPVSWISYHKNYEIQQKRALSPTYGNLFAYAANNPVHYIDPDGNFILKTSFLKENHFYQQDSTRNIAKSSTPVSTDGCYAVANTRVINAINYLAKIVDPQCSELGFDDVDFLISQNESFDVDLLSVQASSALINKFTAFETSTQRIEGKGILTTLEKYSSSKTDHAAIVGKIQTKDGFHFLNVEGISYDADGKMVVNVFDTSNKKRTVLNVSDFKALDVTTWKIFGGKNE